MPVKSLGYVREMLVALAEERLTLAARLDAIDLVRDNLVRVWPGVKATTATPQRAKKKLRRAKRTVRRLASRQPRAVAGADSSAHDRRVLLQGLIVKSSTGLTNADLRKATPKMESKARLNSLQRLKEQGLIHRAGNTWLASS